MKRDRWLDLGVLLMNAVMWVGWLLAGVSLGRYVINPHLLPSLTVLVVVLFAVALVALWRGLGATSVWNGEEDLRTLTWFGRALAWLGSWWRRG